MDLDGMNQRLPKSLKIHRSAEIRQILTSGHKHIGNHIIFHVLASNVPEAPTRAGFLSPRRLGKAVKRNLVRRRMREIFRQYRVEMKSSQKILMMGRPSAIHATYQMLHDDFLRLCRKACLLQLCDE